MASLTEQATRIADSYIAPDTGRPSLLGDADAVSALLHHVSQGNYIETSCLISGISKNTLYRWLKEAEQVQDPSHPAVRFRDALKKAEAIAEAEDVANVRRAGRTPQYWAASMTHLERRHPDRWAKRSEVDTGPKVIVQIGIGSDSVRTGENLVNGISIYQTQTDGESLLNEALTAPYDGANGAKVLGESVSGTGTAGQGEQGQQAGAGRENP